MITLLALLCSCGTANAEASMTELRASLLGAENLHMSISMTAETDGGLYACSLLYDGTASSGDMTVTAPESIAGLSALVSVDDITVSFGDTALCLGFAAEELTPASAVPVLLDQWKYGYIDRCYRETSDETALFAFDSHISDAVTQTTWFSCDTHFPVRSEIYDGGYMIISCNYSDVSF